MTQKTRISGTEPAAPAHSPNRVLPLSVARLGVCLCALGVLGPFTIAQDDTGSSPVDERREEAERLVPRVPGDVEAFAPTAESVTEPVRPGLTGGADWVTVLDADWADPAQSGLLPERTFLNRVRGRLMRGPHGTVIFIPDPAEPSPGGSSAMPPAVTPSPQNGPAGSVTIIGEPADSAPSTAAPLPTRPMLLLPCGLLDRFNEYVLDGNKTTEAIVSGQVFLYADRNYVLPTGLDRARPLSAPPVRTGETDAVSPDGPPGGDAEAGAEPKAPTAGPALDGEPRETGGPNEIGDDPDVEALIAELERRPPYGTPRPVAQSDADEPSEAPSAPMIDPGDGVYVSAQRGRLVRAKNGTWSFQIDNDAPPVLGRDVTEYTLLPCRALQGIESIALSSGDGEAGELSGRAYRSGGGWYLLPTLFQRDRRDGVDPLQ